MNQLIANLIPESPLFHGGLALMLAGWLGYQARAMPARVVAFVRSWISRIVEVRDTHPHYDAWLAMLTENAVRRGGPRTLEVRTQRDAEGHRLAEPMLAAGTDWFWARVRGKWCHVVVRREEAATRTNPIPPFILEAEIFNCTRAELQAIVDDVTRRTTRVEPMQLVDVYDRNACVTTIKIPKRDPATLCLPRGMFETVEGRLREFCSAREQYDRAGIPWRFGVLLAGPPGTGKTSLARALAARLGLRIAVVPLADLESDRELMEVFLAVESQAILLIEDVDSAFCKRDGEEVSGVSFSGFLNCIDGVMAPNNGRILIMSTNHVERLDPALIRPGRVDLRLEVPHLSRDAAADYADRVFPHVSTRHDVVNEVMALPHPTPAVLINQLTLQRWHRAHRAPAGECGGQPLTTQEAS